LREAGCNYEEGQPSLGPDHGLECRGNDLKINRFRGHGVLRWIGSAKTTPLASSGVQSDGGETIERLFIYLPIGHKLDARVMLY
jgi:hypothetical protein